MSDEIKENSASDCEIEENAEPEAKEPPAEEDGLEQGERAVLDDSDLYPLFEAILFLFHEPLPVLFFAKNFDIDQNNAKIILDSLVDEYEERDGGIKLILVAGGYQFVTNRKYAREIRRVMTLKKKEGMTKGMLETLAIIAYKQPTILAEIEQLRGVSSRPMLAKLMRMNMVKPVGRKNLPGRPLLYGTTDDFLKHFGLNSLADLPNIAELDAFATKEGETLFGD